MNFIKNSIKFKSLFEIWERKSKNCWIYVLLGSFPLLCRRLTFFLVLKRFSWLIFPVLWILIHSNAPCIATSITLQSGCASLNCNINLAKPFGTSNLVCRLGDFNFFSPLPPLTGLLEDIFVTSARLEDVVLQIWDWADSCNFLWYWSMKKLLCQWKLKNKYSCQETKKLQRLLYLCLCTKTTIQRFQKLIKQKM